MFFPLILRLKRITAHKASLIDNRELKQPRRQRQEKPHKFAYLTMKNRIFARFARAFFIFWRFEDVLVLSTTWNDLFCSCVDDVNIWRQMFNFVFYTPQGKCPFTSLARMVFIEIQRMKGLLHITVFWRCVYRCRRRMHWGDLVRTTARVTMTLENNDLIGWMRINNRAARAARTSVQFFDVICQMTTCKFQI